MSATNGHLEPHAVLPTFSSLRAQPERPRSYAESSHASSSRSAVSRSQTRSDHTEGDKGSRQSSPLVKEEEPMQGMNRGSPVHGTIRRSKRASGGFLLESSPNSSRLSRSLLSQKLVKGKEKPDDQALSVPKRRLQVDGHDSPSSSRASPLSSEIKSSPPMNGHSVQDHQNGWTNQQFPGSLRSDGTASSRQQASSYGFDSDPSQIVEMALRLNEGRRRQASARRYVSGPTEGRRIVSTATTRPPRSSPSAKSDRQSDNQPAARLRPSNPDPITPQKRGRELENEPTDTLPPTVGELSPEQDAITIEDEMQISRATQKRVENAKAYFELAYEHRRILSHLPPVRNPHAQIRSEQPGYDSKAYNPLQYVRNRKLRFREKAPLDAEGEGWHDVLKVRAWVDAVVNNHPQTKHDPLECVRLPPLTLLDKDPNELDNDPNVGLKKAGPTGRPRRPKSDWVTHPGDIIADAFWTEQGLNKQKIYNRDNEPVFPPGTKFHFSGWRNRTPINVPAGLRSSSPGSPPSFDRQDSVPAAPDLPVFESAHKDHGWGMARSKFASALHKKSKNTKNNDKIFDTSSESSDSGGVTEPRKESRGRKRRAKHHEKLSLPHGDPFDEPAKGAERRGSDSIDVSRRHSRQDSIDHANLLRYLRRNSTSLSETHNDHDKHKLGRRRGFLGNIRLDSEPEYGRSSFESTAPPTPAHLGFPSIAINLSPPDSRSQSPGQKPRGSFLGVVKDKIQSQKDHIERTDFAGGISSSNKGSEDSASQFRHKVASREASRDTSSRSRGTSPFTQGQHGFSLDEGSPTIAEPRASTISKTSTRTTDSAGRQHRVRGMFKGGRIAELVGNEVSRVGDFIWKRDPPRRSDITETGSNSGYESDSDDLSDVQDKTPERVKQARQPPNGATPDSPVTKTSPREAMQYHIQGLPSFTSPFQRDKAAQDEKEDKLRAQSPGGTRQEKGDKNDNHLDPIVTGSAASRAGRSPRFNNLMPPKLDIRAATPDGRRSSYGFGQAYDLSRTRSASQLYNSAINDSGSQPQGGRRSAAGDLSQWQYNDITRSASRPGTQITSKYVNIHDTLRVRALLVAIAVKATNISTHHDSYPDQQSSFLYSAYHSTGAPDSSLRQHLPLRRREEHSTAARHLISHLQSQSHSFNTQLQDFTQHTTTDLHRQIQILEDNADKSLFPRLQSLSDTVGQLAQKLTTTSTLAVKSVNDEVADAVRLRRRGTYRAGQWLGYKLMEAGIVSVLWLIWFVVTIIRFGLGSVRCVKRTVQWLLFLR